jgi:hypothetical protein
MHSCILLLRSIQNAEYGYSAGFIVLDIIAFGIFQQPASFGCIRHFIIFRISDIQNIQQIS